MLTIRGDAERHSSGGWPCVYASLAVWACTPTRVLTPRGDTVILARHDLESRPGPEPHQPHLLPRIARDILVGPAARPEGWRLAFLEAAATTVSLASITAISTLAERRGAAT